VDESIAEGMNICAVDFPPGTSEIAAAGLSTHDSKQVKVPRIAESPVSFECREVQTIEIGRNRVIFGQVLQMHIRDDLVDAEKLHITPKSCAP
jgi:flavin reductase (DIM6/NTAB) family NADH-FMN oxidoreductase RutF